MTSPGIEPITFRVVAECLNLQCLGRAIAQAVSRWLPTVETLVRARL
jgi:hypothetical protein